MLLLSVVGTCPHCGDDLAVFKTRQYKRLIKCLNEECTKSIYPIPKSGEYETTGEICPKNKYPILAFTPSKIKRNRSGVYRSRTFFWVKAPCFSCFDKSSCEPWKELQEEYN